MLPNLDDYLNNITELYQNQPCHNGSDKKNVLTSAVSLTLTHRSTTDCEAPYRHCMTLFYSSQSWHV